MAVTEDAVGKCAKCVEDTFGTRKLNNHTCTTCVVIYTKDEDGNATLGQDEYIKQLRGIHRPELTGADADAQAFNLVADMFVSLRGALAYVLIAQVWLVVHVASLQRVHEPTNIQVRRLGAITRKLQACPNKIVYQAMTPTGDGDLHSGSGYRRLSGDADDDVKCYGIRGASLLRRGSSPSGEPVVNLFDARCMSHRLQ
eukprot:2432505-Pyramimonas_sp.AAC.1